MEVHGAASVLTQIELKFVQQLIEPTRVVKDSLKAIFAIAPVFCYNFFNG